MTKPTLTQRRYMAERVKRKMSKTDLAYSAKMQAATIGMIESGRYIPYESQIKKIAKALKYEGDPWDLWEELPTEVMPNA